MLGVILCLSCAYRCEFLIKDASNSFFIGMIIVVILLKRHQFISQKTLNIAFSGMLCISSVVTVSYTHLLIQMEQSKGCISLDIKSVSFS